MTDGSSTKDIGLIGSGYTNSATGFRNSTASKLNEAGQAIGGAAVYNGSSYIGKTSWLYDGTTTTEIGITGGVHINNSGSHNTAKELNESGQVIGFSQRYNNGSYNGTTAWLYDGVTTKEIGLTSSGHINSSTAFQKNSSNKINEAGQVLGSAQRFDGATSRGYDAWLYNGATTKEIGLTGGVHTDSNGTQNNSGSRLNDAGQVTGYAQRYNGTAAAGYSAWLYDDDLDQTFFQDFSVRSSDGYSYSNAQYLGDDGLMLGNYELFDIDDSSLGYYAFSFTIEDGFTELGLLVNDLDDAGWLSLSYALSSNEAEQIIGTGILNDTASTAAYLLTPHVSAVPVPAAAWLFGSGLIGLVGFARRKKA